MRWISSKRWDSARCGGPRLRDGIPFAWQVLLTLAMLPHAVFTRDGSDLKMKLRITLSEALMGFKRKVGLWWRG